MDQLTPEQEKKRQIELCYKHCKYSRAFSAKYGYRASRNIFPIDEIRMYKEKEDLANQRTEKMYKTSREL